MVYTTSDRGSNFLGIIDVSSASTITSTPDAVLPLFVTKFAACTGGI